MGRRTGTVLNGAVRWVAIIFSVLSVGIPVAASESGVSDAAAPVALLDARLWDGSGAPVRAASLLIAEQRIAKIGTRAEIEAAARALDRSARMLDLAGAMVLPGLRDQHVHIMDTGIPGVAGGAAAPGFSEYNPVQSEALRAVILGYHGATFAQGQHPESGCSHSAVTDEMKALLLDAEEEMLRQGLTATVEAGLSDLGYLDALFELSREGALRSRWLPRVGAGCMADAAAAGYVSGFGDEWVRVLGVKLYADGWLGPRSAALRDWYSDRPYDGLLFLTPDAAAAEIAQAQELGFHITTHAIGDRGIETVLNAYAGAGVTPAHRWQIEHAQVTDLALMDRFAELGVVASIQTSFATTDQRFAESALGEARLATSYNWVTMLEQGVPLVGSTDFPVEVLAPLWGVQRMVTRVEFDGFPEAEGFQPGQRLPLARTLQLITRDAAWASLEEDERGTVEVGKFADLTVIRENLFALPADCLASATVLLTMVNGRIGFEGEQAYPPGAADCPSGAAPAAEPQIREVPSSGQSVRAVSPPAPRGGGVSPALLAMLILAAALWRPRRSTGIQFEQATFYRG